MVGKMENIYQLYPLCVSFFLWDKEAPVSTDHLSNYVRYLVHFQLHLKAMLPIHY